MMVFKKKEIVAAALVMLIGMAGYLNWSYQDTVQVRDGAEFVETGKKIGEAELVSANKEKSDKKEDEKKAENEGDYFANAISEKEMSRSKSLEILNETAQNSSFDSEVRRSAQEKILEFASITEKETAVENIARAKGYDKICVFVNEDIVDITVKKDGFGEEDVVKITEIAQNQLGIPTKNIKVVEVK